LLSVQRMVERWFRRSTRFGTKYARWMVLLAMIGKRSAR
jgi:hypothetical protein